MSHNISDISLLVNQLNIRVPSAYRLPLISQSINHPYIRCCGTMMHDALIHSTYAYISCLRCGMPSTPLYPCVMPPTTIITTVIMLPSCDHSLLPIWSRNPRRLRYTVWDLDLYLNILCLDHSRHVTYIQQTDDPWWYFIFWQSQSIITKLWVCFWDYND